MIRQDHQSCEARWGGAGGGHQECQRELTARGWRTVGASPGLEVGTGLGRGVVRYPRVFLGLAGKQEVAVRPGQGRAGLGESASVDVVSLRCP